MKIIIAVFLSGILLTHSALWGQEDNKPIFEHFGIKEGLQSSQVLSMAKSQNGFLWLGTESGLVRYDGHIFKKYDYNPDQKNSLQGVYISSIIIDENEQLWIINSNKLSVFDLKTEKFTSYSGGYLKAKLFYDKNTKRKIIITVDKIYEIIGGQNRIIEWKAPALIKNKIILSVVFEGKNILWLGGPDGLFKYDTANNTITDKSDDIKNKEFPHDINTMYHDGSDHLWLGCWSYGLIEYNIKTGASTTHLYQDKNRQNGILSIEQSVINNGPMLWIGTVDGLYWFDIKKREFKSLISDDYGSKFRIPGAIFSLLKEKDDIWIGSFRGLHRYNKSINSAELIKVNFRQESEVKEIGKVFLEPNKKDSIAWILRDYDQVYKVDLINGKEIALPKSLSQIIKNNTVINILLDQSNFLWISDEKAGLIKYNTKTNQFAKVADSGKPDKYFEIIETKNKDIWVTGIKSLYKYDNVNNKIFPDTTYLKYIKANEIDGHIYNLTFHSDELWCILKNKNDQFIIRYNTTKNKILHYKMSEHMTLKRLNHLQYLNFYNDSTFIITSFNGLCEAKVNGDLINFAYLRSPDNRTFGSTNNIVVDKNKDCWMGNNFGILRYRPLNRTITNFANANYNLPIEPNLLITPSNSPNYFYISGSKYLYKWNIDIFNKPTMDTVHLVEIKIKNYQKLLPIKNISNLELKHFQNSIILSFSTFNYFNSSEHIYQYSLNQGAWQYFKGAQLEFNALSPGTYNLKVRCLNSLGHYSLKNFNLDIKIFQIWYKSLWFLSLFGSAIIAMIFSFFKYRDLERQKLATLRFNIARDLHDDMGSNLSQIKIMSEIEAYRTKDPKFITIAEKLSEIMQSMSEIVWSINPKNDHLEEVISRIQEFAIQTLEPIAIKLKFDIEILPEEYNLNPEEKRHFYLVFKEAINNIAKYSKATDVIVSIKLEGKNLVCKILDNGIGFDPSYAIKGNGIKNMQSRATSLKGKLGIETSNKGTIITLII